MIELEGGIKTYYPRPAFFYWTLRTVSVNASRSAYGQCKNYILNFVRVHAAHCEKKHSNLKLCALHV